jgi:cell division protease FtsH
MVARWGMSETIGPVDLRDSDEHPFLGREIAQPRRHSEHSARAIDEAVRGLLVEAEQRALEMIRTHRSALAALIDALEDRETLDKADVEGALSDKESSLGSAIDQAGRP